MQEHFSRDDAFVATPAIAAPRNAGETEAAPSDLPNEALALDELAASRRNFLGGALAMTGVLAAGGLGVGLSAAQAQGASPQGQPAPAPGATPTPSTPAAAGAMPMLPRLAERPLKPSTLNTTGISRRTHEEHFKLYQGYVRKSNELFERLASVTRDPSRANQISSEIRDIKVELTFALGGVKNHELYFDVLGGTGSSPSGRLLEEINRSFGSVANWSADLKASGIAARGWVWTAFDYDLGRLVNYIGDTQNTFPIWNATPIIALDVYEHAYFLDYQTARADYIDAFLNNLNWNVVATRFSQLGAPAANLVTLAL